MATKKKLLQAAAGQAGGAGLNVEDVFSTYLYDGTGSTAQSISNGIDLNGEGGLVWLKSRGGLYSNILYDTERGVNKYLRSNQTIAEGTALSGSGLTAFNSDGFDIGSDWAGENVNYNIASWTFRKHPDFFNVIEYTGDGSNSRDLPHGLNKKPGFIVVKRTDSTGDWVCSHRSSSIGELNSTAAFTGSTTTGTPGENGYAILNAFSNDTTVRIANGVGGLSNANANGASYVAYIWAHNDGDGEFGPDGDADIIKCGSYTGNGSSNGPEIDLGFEPQWLLIKNADYSGSGWSMWDNMRGVTTGGTDQRLYANSNSAEGTTGGDDVYFTATGFGIGVDYQYLNNSGDNIIYIAIRRGPMAVPTDATDVFTPYAPSSNSEDPYWTAGFPVVDFALGRWNTGSTGNMLAFDRLRGSGVGLETNTTDSESGAAADSNNYISNIELDHMYGFHQNFGFSASTEDMAWMWRRAPSFFDVVAYGPFSSTSTAKTISHNLGVAPEMMWVKVRGDNGSGWVVYHKDVASDPETDYLVLNDTNAVADGVQIWNDTAPTATSFTVGTSSWVQSNLYGSIAYLFASLDGVSKVGSFTTTGSAVNVDCGFSSGARFVLLKAASGTNAHLYNWELYDTERGIVAGNDSVLFPNSTSAEYTAADYIDPYSAGFTFNSGAGGRPSGQTIIFYAIA